MPKVSVIIPVYGVEKYIERCARSLFEQTLNDIEYIFVDDCSPDKSIEILERIIEEYRPRFAGEKKVVAIGEIGLDYYWAENPPKELQQEVLRRQLALAEELSLPVIIHDRDAHADTLAIVREFPHVKGVFHCFAGSVEMARELVKAGWMLSFNGAATFKNARKAPEVIAAVPLDKLMIETDAPYLTPVPHRGERNDSSYVCFVAEQIARIKGISPREVEEATWENGRAFFGI